MLQMAFSSCILIMILSANSDQWQRLAPTRQSSGQSDSKFIRFFVCISLNFAAQQRETISNYDAILLR